MFKINMVFMMVFYQNLIIMFIYFIMYGMVILNMMENIFIGIIDVFFIGILMWLRIIIDIFIYFQMILGLIFIFNQVFIVLGI